MRRRRFFQKMEHDAEGLRFATPERVAAYRAKRLSCSTLLEIGCGIGAQTIAFARTCERVLAVDIDPIKVRYAKKNCKRAKAENVHFFVADGVSDEFVSRIEGVDYVFCDPSRAPTEPKRTLDGLSPAPAAVLERYGGLCRGIAIEAPPQLTPERVPLQCEKEYVSLDGALNRLTLYFGELMECDRSCVCLSETEEGRLCSDGEGVVVSTRHLGRFCFEPDPALLKAELLAGLAHVLNEQIEVFVWDDKRRLITSDHMLCSPFFTHTFSVVAHLRGERAIQDANRLVRDSAKRILIRGSIAPDDYWTVRRALEDGICGNDVFHAFLRGDEVLVLKALEESQLSSK
ncbi:MAG: class I SAM-dependent methyltransferase [Methermicoccaceae archaeon]